MLKMYIDNEEVVSKNDFTIKEEMLSASSTILNNTYPKSWETDKDYISRFYYPKDYSKLILNKDTYYPHIDGETIEGSSFQITADTTLEDEYYFKGNTYQEQTSGKNLYNVGTLTTTTSSGITFTPYYEDNKLQYINVNGTATANVFYNLGRITLPAGSYIANGCTGGTTMTYQIGINFGLGRLNVVNGDVSFTLSEARTMNESFIRVQSGTTVNNVKIYPMIRLSSITDATYEPYTNGPTPNPNYPQPIQVVTGNQEIEVCGKNLFNGIFELGIINGTTGQNASNNSYIRNKDYIPVEELTNYKFSTDNTNITTMLVYEYKADYSYNLATNKGVNLSDYLTTNSGTRYIRFRPGYQTTDTTIKVMLNKGNTALPYEPYIGNTYEINLGKNLLIYPYYDTSNSPVVSNDVTWTDNGDGTISVQGTPTGYSEFKISTANNKLYVEPNTTYTISGCDYNNNVVYDIYERNINNTQVGYYGGRGQYTFTTTNDTKWLQIAVKRRSNNVGIDFIVKPQLEKGNVATSFSPYFTPIELCKINDYKDSIKKSEGKNLFDKDTATTQVGYFSSDGTINSGGSSTITTSYIEIIPNVDITISGINLERICIYDSNKTFIERLNGNGTTTNTINVNASYIRIQSATSGFNLNTIMINEGSTPLPYEPYLAKGKWYIEKNIGKVVLDGTQNISKNSTSATNYLYYYRITDKANGGNVYTYYLKQREISDVNGTNTLEKVGCALSTTNVFYFNIGYYVSGNTTTDMNNYFSTHNLYIYYILATPTYTEITNEELISQLNSIELLDGLNNISITSANLSMIMNLHYNFQTEHTDSELIFSGMVKNTNNISLNPREPKYCSLEILDYKTLLSEGKTLDYVISNKTILEAITMVVNSISEYGFELGNVNILNGDEIIGAYSTENKTAYDVLQYLADISSAKWNCRRKDNTNMYIDFYDPTLMPRGKQIEYTNEWACENNLCDIKFNYGTRDYRNKQIILSDEVEGSIEYNDRVVSDGINKEYTLPYKIATLNKIEIDGVEQSIATKEEKEVGIYADFYYSRNNDTFTSNKTLPYGTLIDVSYTPIIKGREVVQNDSEIDRLTNQLEVNGTISRYENRNDTTDSNKLINIGETYLKYKGEAEITLTIRTENNNLYNVGQIVYFNAPIPELQKDYLVKSKQIQVISSDENELNIFYTFTLSSSFNAEKEINWFDNQRAKTEGNIGEGEFISRNIDINSRANIIWDNLRVEEVDLPVGASNDLQATLESPLIH